MFGRTDRPNALSFQPQGWWCISINTVTAHRKNIYRKLATTHRGQTVRRACRH
jgi:hypothetical protein